MIQFHFIYVLYHLAIEIMDAFYLCFYTPVTSLGYTVNTTHQSCADEHIIDDLSSEFMVVRNTVSGTRDVVALFYEDMFWHF